MEEELNNKEMYDKIQTMLDNMPDNYSILEEQIDIDVQMEYFKAAQSIKSGINKEEILSKIEFLFDEETELNKKKDILSKLASIEEVDAFRAIEKYNQKPDSDLREWAILALKESKLVLESQFLEENQIFISTGLGGKENKLRYFLVFLNETDNEFTNIQKSVIRSEFNDILISNASELESVQFEKEVCTMTALLPLKSPIREIFKNAIATCNELGSFLKENFLLTNVKIMTYKEIKEFLAKTEKNKS